MYGSRTHKTDRQLTSFQKNRFFNAVLFSQGSIDLQPEIKEDCSYINASRLPCPGGALIMAQVDDYHFDSRNANCD